MIDTYPHGRPDLRERAREYFGGPGPEKLFRRMMLFSVIGHAVVCGVVFTGALNIAAPKSRFLDNAVEVSLVNLPAPKKSAVPAPDPVAPVAAPAAAPAPAPTASLAVPAPSTKPVPTGRDSSPRAPPADDMFLKRKELEAERKARLEREILGEDKKDSRLSEREKLRAALSALKEQGVPERQAAPAESPGARTVEEIEQQLASAARRQSALDTADRVSSRRETEYRAHVKAKVSGRWRAPANLLRRRDLLTVVEFRINADGTVVSAKVVESSGESAFDDSVLRAVREVEQFDIPPQEFPRVFTVGFNNIEG